MAKLNSNQDRDEGVQGHLLTQQDNEKQLLELDKLTKEPIDTSGNPPASSQWSTGRTCPKCKGLLKMKELNEDSGHLWVFCGSCKAEYSAEDLENTNANGDKLHRAIPDRLVMSWMAAREDELKRRGE